MSALVFFFNDTATTEIYTLSLHDALPIYAAGAQPLGEARGEGDVEPDPAQLLHAQKDLGGGPAHDQAALIHDDEAIEEGGLGHRVGDVQDARAPAAGVAPLRGEEGRGQGGAAGGG